MAKYICPLCKVEMEPMDGEKMHPGDSKYGVTLYCINMECPAEEVFGHGDKIKDAYEVVIAKYAKVKKE